MIDYTPPLTLYTNDITIFYRWLQIYLCPIKIQRVLTWDRQVGNSTNQAQFCIVNDLLYYRNDVNNVKN